MGNVVKAITQLESIHITKEALEVCCYMVKGKGKGNVVEAITQLESIHITIKGSFRGMLVYG